MKKYVERIVILVCFLATVINSQELTRYVDPFIGTGGHGHTYPGATLPFGMVQISPDTRTGNWDACGGYHHTDNTIMGFSHQHLSGVGCLDYGDILFMPITGERNLDPGSEDDPDSGYRSRFDHSSEKASPGYYSVVLKDYDIKVELTATTRCGFHKYTYPQGKTSNLIINLNHQLETGESITNLELELVDMSTIKGLRRSVGWAADQVVYFYAEFSKPIAEYGIYKDGENTGEGRNISGKDLKAFLAFNNEDNEPLLVKVGISAVDYDGAKKNLEAEIPGWDFDKVKNNANDRWNEQLSKIIIEDKDETKKTIFYTALYHTSVVPNTYYDVDRRYRGNDRKVHVAASHDNYTVFSLWDTFRSTHPLYVLIDRERTSELIKTILVKYQESGVLPKWELAGNETGTMIGYHSVSAIVDAYFKGIKDFDTELALEAMIATASIDNHEMNIYREYGYLPSDMRRESVAKTLEYAYDDWCIYRFAEAIGNSEVADEFKERALNYINLFDGSTGFFRGKKSNGNWISPFDSFEISRDYTEANAWQYSMFVPHDINGLVNLHGSKKKFADHMDRLFTEEGMSNSHDLQDVTGLIGQYAHGNEPSHHAAYIYNFLDEPWKTQERIAEINKDMYSAAPDGLIGNEDCGQMSSWFNFSSLGFYPFCPGTEEYQLGSPFFQKAIINLENGKTIEVKADNLSDENIYVQSVLLNGEEINRPYILHSEISEGATIEYVMGNKPNYNRGTEMNPSPYSMNEMKTTSIPYIKSEVGYFINEVPVEFDCKTDNVEIRYTLDGSEPDCNSKLFEEAFTIDKSMTIKARAFKEGYIAGPIMTAKAVKAEFLESAEVSNLTNGVKYKYIEGQFSSAKELINANVVKEGELDYITLDEADKEDHYAFIYEGFINIPEDDIYTFYCKSDDGSILFINDKEIVNNDGSHAAISASASVALKKGMHPFTLLYFEDYEGNSVEVFWETNKTEKELLPKAILYK